jgi:histidine kinase/DNA gyrase B/HSP90-like ATPase
MMSRVEKPASVNIRPGVSILSVLRHLNYKPWFAMAEFVDNSLQSFLSHSEALKRTEGAGFKLKVTIERDPADETRISIRDNAAGIHESEYPRAFRPAAIPLDRSGLSEFGMGMKSAACWFAPRWTVRTSALGERREKTVSFDIETIVRDDLEELQVQVRDATTEQHFTEIVLHDLYNPPQGRTLNKIKEHLASIFRIFIRKGILELRFGDELLSDTEPRVLVAPFYKRPSEEAKSWKKEIDFDFGLGLRARGFAAIRETASTSSAGFALFRRERLIQGSADEGYRPEFVFGKPNSYRYQRIFGELHLDGFEISHTKDGFKWNEHEEVFLQILKEELNKEPLPLLEQAEEHRVRANPKDLKRGAEMASERTAEVIRSEVPPVLERQVVAAPDTAGPPEVLPKRITASSRTIDVELQRHKWRIVLDLSDDPAVGDWITVSDRSGKENAGRKEVIREVSVRLSLAHPFMERFGGTEQAQIEPLLRVAAAIGLSEIAARDSGVKMAGTMRRNINELLRNALSKP